jgi:hypothetical protein
LQHHGEELFNHPRPDELLGVRVEDDGGKADVDRPAKKDQNSMRIDNKKYW